MDIFSILSTIVFLLVPFVCYFLFFKKNDGRSIYSDRDIFYLIKLCLAKKVIRAGQARFKQARQNTGYTITEPEIGCTPKKNTYYQTIQGCDQKGNGLSLKFTLRETSLAEVNLYLKLANGHVYSFPAPNRVKLSNLKSNQQWKINGLVIENLEPYKRIRIVFNGLLQNLAYSTEKIEHVQFNFIFNCCSSPKFYPEDCDTNILAETVATRIWKDNSWKSFLLHQPEGYEQFGSLIGFIKGDAFRQEQMLSLPACRSKYACPEESQDTLKRDLRLFLVTANGVMIKLNIQSFSEKKSQLNYGYIFHKNNITVPITGQDLRLKHIGNVNSLPDVILAHVSCKTNDYKIVFHLNKSSQSYASSKTGFTVHNLGADCDVNVFQGKSVLDYTFYHAESRLETPDYVQILSEKKVDVLPENLVVGIKSEDAKIVELTGGKGASLALLSSIKTEDFTVPEGFILTINAFRRQLSEKPQLQKAVQNIVDVFCGRDEGNQTQVCEEAVEAFRNEPIHSEIVQEVIANLDQFVTSSKNENSEISSWAVRSSAIGEDSEELSAAGQNETILGVAGTDEVLKAVAKCWASLFTFQSVQYRWQHGLPIDSEMAVVVQKMVPADSAGVLFTWHPSTSNPSQIVITSNYGLGESVVSGQTEPDTFILKRSHTGEVMLKEQVLGSKEQVLTLTQEGVRQIETCEDPENNHIIINGEDVRERWSISKDQAIKLGRIGVFLELAFSGPRDIEWAYYKGELYLLQSRPITTLNTWTEFELTHEFDSPVIAENSIYTMANTGEVFSVATSALTRTSPLEAIDRGIQRNIDSTSISNFLKGICSFQHRVMIDVILAIHVNARYDDIKMTSRILDLALFGHEVINEQINSMAKERWGSAPLFHEGRMLCQQFIRAGKVKEYIDKISEFVTKLDFGIKDGDSVRDMYAKITSKQDTMDTPSYYHSAATAASIFWQMLCMATLVGDSKKLKTEHYADFANILSSCEDVVSAEVPMYLEKIAKIIRDEGYTEEFCTVKAEFGVDWIRSKCPAAYRLLEEFLKKHGHRCLGEFELLEETWGYNPALLVPMLQANAKHLREMVKKYKSIDEVINGLTSPTNFVTRKILKFGLRRLRVAVGKREQSKSATILAIDKLRSAYRALAKEMVLQGLIPSEKIIYHLSAHELSEVINKRSPLLLSKAMKRQRLYPKWNQSKFPELNHGYPEPEKELTIPLELVPGSKCTGTPVCAGTTTARACVITSLDDIELLEKGDVLITYCTDIGWSPYFPMLSGVVTELGGLVSHGAVVAREYGLPCIVGVKNVTKMFSTGDMVHLSGQTGELGKL